MPYDESQGTRVPTYTDNATTFHARDVPDTPRADGTESKRQLYKRLFTEYQTGNYNGKWGDQTKLRTADNAAMFDAISSQLELPQFLKEHGREWLSESNLREYGQPVRLVVFCICAKLYNSEAAYDNRYHPNRTDENNPQRYLDMTDELGISAKNVNSVYNKVGVDLE